MCGETIQPGLEDDDPVEPEAVASATGGNEEGL